LGVSLTDITVNILAQLLKIDRPVIVEGKHDKIKLSCVIDANILTTDGFRIFSSDEKTALIRRLAEKHGVIVLTDSDGAGLVIRNHINSILPKEKITHLYIPEVAGKERRKKQPSKAGTLGVEGIEAEYFKKLFAPFAVSDDAEENTSAEKTPVTKADFYSDGFSGGEGSMERRKKLAAKLGLPTNISANALLEAINMLYTCEEYTKMVGELNE